METALTVKQVAPLLGCTETNLYRLISAGKIPFFRLGGAVRFLPSQLELFMRGEWTPKAPKRRPGRQLKVYPVEVTPETNLKLQ
jgi:excisionase family DNA binding protein